MAKIFNKNKKRLVALLLIGAMLLAGVSAFFAQGAFADQISDLEDKQGSIQNQINEINKQLALTKDKINKEAKSAEETADKIAEKRYQIDLYAQKIALTEENITQKQAEIDEKLANIAENEDLFAKRVRAIYIAGADSTLNVLLGAKNFSDFLSRAELLRRMSKSDQELISELTKQKDELTKMKDELLKQKADLQNTKASLQSDKKKLDSEYNESTQTQAQLKAQQRKYLEIQEKNKAEIKKIDKMIDDLISQSNDPNAPTSGFKWPVPGKSRISSPFGWRKLNGVDDFHLGIDIPGPTGTDIVAAQSGRVIIVVPASSSYGKYVVIDHGGGYSTLYAHTSATNVSVGQTVIKGQKIADIGNTGNSYGSHLHFEVRINGERKNPSLYVKP